MNLKNTKYLLKDSNIVYAISDIKFEPAGTLQK